MRFSLLSPFFFLAACQPQDPAMTADAGPDSMTMVDECPPAAGAGTMHTALATAETWTAAASPHVIPGDLDVRAPLTIEGCAVVKIASGRTITIRSNGSITASGTSTRPVVFDEKDAGQPWAQIRTLGGGMSFTYTSLLHGGSMPTTVVDGAAVLDVQGITLEANHLSIKDSATQGILMVGGGMFSATSTDLTITGSKHFPMHVAANAAGTIPAGTYTGNAKDEITLVGTGASKIDRDVTFHARGVPYRFGFAGAPGDLVIEGTNSVATLTIEPGVTLRFKKDGLASVQYTQNTKPATAALVAVGTAASPIVFTSAEDSPTPGDWSGVYFNGVPNPNDKLDFVRVEWAGSSVSQLVGLGCTYDTMPPKPNYAAIRIFVEPASAFITNTKIVGSAWLGIDRNWTGTAAISFLGGNNDLSGNAKCKESFPHPNQAPCPMPPPCP